MRTGRYRGAAVLAFAVLLPAIAHAAETALDARDVGLPLPWLIFGFAAQAVFAARFLWQWIVSERQGRSVIPVGFWILSLVGGLSLFVYFTRRGDPVGMLGQSFGVLVYSRNLYLIARERRAGTRPPGSGDPS